MNSPFEGYNPGGSPTAYGTEDGTLQLTPEELNILKECNREGIVNRAVPVGVTLGIASHFLAQQLNMLKHAKWGTIPVVVSTAFAGYMAGRLSYFPVCYERLMNVPNGIVRQRAERAVPGRMGAPYMQAPVQVDPRSAFAQTAQSRPTDLDTLTTSTFDTMPSNLDSDTPRLPNDPLASETPQRYSSYDELRERNRREYMERMQRQSYPQAQPGFGPQPGYPPAQPGYPPGQPGYPPQQPVYSPSQPGYPPQQPGYTPSQSGFQGDPMVPLGQPNYQRKRLPVQPGDSEMAPTQGTGRTAKTKYGDEWEF